MVESGEYDKIDNPLKNAPHSEEVVCGDEWNHKYMNVNIKNWIDIAEK